MRARSRLILGLFPHPIPPRGALALVAILALPAILLGAAPVERTIAGGRLTIVVGDDTSFQVQDSEFAPLPAFNPRCVSLDLADTGVLVSVAGTVYGPDFAEHVCGTAAPAFTPWTPVSISDVTGAGTAADPFRVVIVVDAGSSGLRLTETITHVAGSDRFLPSLAFSNAGPAPSTFDAFLATDMYLSIQYVQPLLWYGVPGGWAAEKLGAPTPACAPDPYYALLPQADRYSGHDAPVMWGEIAAGQLSNTMDYGCSFGGIATQWAARSLGPGQTVVVGPGGGIAFIEGSPFVVPAVPVLSPPLLALAAAALAVAGLLAARRIHPG